VEKGPLDPEIFGKRTKNADETLSAKSKGGLNSCTPAKGKGGTEKKRGAGDRQNGPAVSAPGKKKIGKLFGGGGNNLGAKGGVSVGGWKKGTTIVTHRMREKGGKVAKEKRGTVGGGSREKRSIRERTGGGLPFLIEGRVT